MLKKLLGIAPKKEPNGSFSPSLLALKLATSTITNYDHTEYEKPYSGEKWKIMVICTEESHLKMTNGTSFLTGNHPVETLVPILHFLKAGFNSEIFTLTGKSAQLEQWAMPSKDDSVMNLYQNIEAQFKQPKSLTHVSQDPSTTLDEYAAIFIPGGHGALIGLPESVQLSRVLSWAHETNRLICSICHGPAAFLAARPQRSDTPFLFKGYKMSVFPDSIDSKTPFIGYMPGHLPWKFGEVLTDLGVNIVNKKADKTCVVDRNLVTGASPDAANDFGKLVVQELLKRVK